MIKPLPEHHKVTIITLETIGPVEVSTIDFQRHPYITGLSYSETCLFWNLNPNGSARNTETVQTYPSWAEASKAHAYWCDPANAARAIAACQR